MLSDIEDNYPEFPFEQAGFRSLQCTVQRSPLACRSGLSIGSSNRAHRPGRTSRTTSLYDRTVNNSYELHFA